MEINKSIFRSYDIRGVYPQDINEKAIEHIGRALGTFMKQKSMSKVVVGMDDRFSSTSLKKHFITGLLSTGCDVTDVGLTTTPAIHYLMCVSDFDVGANITASHNPKEFNGIRIRYSKAVPFYGDDIQTLHDLAKNELYEIGMGELNKANYNNEYIEYMKSRFSYSKKFKVALECGNGMASVVAPQIFEGLGCEVGALDCSMNPDFPKGVPNPENRAFMAEIAEEVVKQGSNVGFGFDTDVDRFGVVDEKGTIYSTDKILMLMSKYVLSSNPGAVVLYDVKSTEKLREVISQNNGIPKMMKTGHPYFSQEIKNGALLGAEYSGHVYFGGDNYGFDDGIFAACKVLEVMDQTGEPLSKLFEEFPKMAHSDEIKIACPDDLKFQLIETLASMVDATAGVKSISKIDGLRVRVTDTGWFLIRASNTTPRLSLRFEGQDEEEAKMLLQRLQDLLSRFELLNLKELEAPEIIYS